MKVKVLGCSAVELPHARLTSFLVDDRLLLDAGTIGTVLHEKQQSKVRHVLLTHAHLDHIKDLPFLADNIALHNKNRHLKVYSISDVISALKTNIFNDIVWPDFTKIPTSEAPIIRLETIRAGKSFKVDGFRVTAYEVNHAAPAVAYLIEDKKQKKLLYTGDTGPNTKIWQSLDTTHLHALITEVSLPNIQKNIALKAGHLTPVLLKKELEKMKRLPDTIFITHFKPVYKKKVQQELKELNISNIRLLKDGDVHEI
ncbi:MAG: 3',5'-cyclic-nucleotide phosphodiesterase [Nitrospiraceae bacterium]|nr:MAG: 3',5'-cyclic-nucleotide phosphodiesterase [Nitrospiraceae bacterium]